MPGFTYAGSKRRVSRHTRPSIAIQSGGVNVVLDFVHVARVNVMHGTDRQLQMHARVPKSRELELHARDTRGPNPYCCSHCQPLLLHCIGVRERCKNGCVKVAHLIWQEVRYAPQLVAGATWPDSCKCKCK